MRWASGLQRFIKFTLSTKAALDPRISYIVVIDLFWSVSFCNNPTYCIQSVSKQGIIIEEKNVKLLAFGSIYHKMPIN